MSVWIGKSRIFALMCFRLKIKLQHSVPVRQWVRKWVEKCSKYVHFSSLFLQTIVHAKRMISSAVTVCACPAKRAAMDTSIVAIKRTKRGAKARLATFLNSDVPTAKNASPNFRNATIAKNALTDLMRAIAVS